MLKATILATLLVAATGSVLAQEGSLHHAVESARRAGPNKPGKVVSKVRPPVGTPHKASSFAPQHTNKRVYGDPIQAPIVHGAPAPK